MSKSNSISNNARLLSVTFQVFGVYTHGALKGKTNPKESVLVTFFQRSIKNGLVTDPKHERVYMKDFIAAIRTETDNAFFRIHSFEEEPKIEKTKKEVIVEKIRAKVAQGLSMSAFLNKEHREETIQDEVEKILRGDPVIA